MSIKSQRGMTLIGFLFLLSAALFVAYIGMKLVPIYINYYSVVTAMQDIAEEPNAANMSESQIRNSLSRRLSVNYVRNIRPENVDIVRGNGVSLVVEYEVREPLIGNVDAVVSFRREQPLN